MAVWTVPGARWQWAVASVLGIIGFLFVIQVRSNRPLRQEAELPSIRARDLAVLIGQQEATRRTLQSEINALRQTLDEYETATAQGRSVKETMERDAATYRLVLGLTPVEGPGVLIRLKEGRGAGAVVAPTLQAQDLSVLVNELRAAGAEAVAVNGLRILATTGFRQDDQGILIGILRLHPPYTVAAIGNPESIRAALQIRGGFVEGSRAIGIAVEVTEHEQLRLPPAVPEIFRYAAPATR